MGISNYDPGNQKQIDMLQPFHLAVPVSDIETSREFYTNIIGCTAARYSDRWIDLNFFGHQLALHLVESFDSQVATNPVDGHHVPSRHFGIILKWDAWHQLQDRLVKNNQTFTIKPYIRFKGTPGEQATMFFSDPSGNFLEFKAFKKKDGIFTIAKK